MAAAIRTAAQGHRVTVLEAAEEPGGKLREQTHGGYRFDVGPSLFTWPELVLELDALAREKAAPDANLPLLSRTSDWTGRPITSGRTVSA